MDAYDLLLDKIKYNQWANAAIIGWLKQKAHDKYEHKVISSFSSINKALHHIMESETYYMSILQGVEADYHDYQPTETIFNDLILVDKALVDWFEKQKEDYMDDIISLKRSPVTEGYTVATLVTHMLNHSTYHRGQIVAMRHQLDMEAPPRTDYYRYFIHLHATEWQ